jgi:hypothetical protein
MQHHWLSRAAALLCLLLPWPAAAGPIYWQLNGEITDNPPNPPGTPYAELDTLLPVGTDVTFLIAVDPAAPDLCDDPGAGFYYFPAATMSFGGKSYAADPAFIEVNNILANCIASGLHDALVRLDLGAAGIGPLATIEMGPFPGDALPTTPTTGPLWVGNFSPAAELCFYENDCVLLDAFGEINSSAIVPAPTVPEPTTFLLLASGLAAIAARRRRSG